MQFKVTEYIQYRFLTKEKICLKQCEIKRKFDEPTCKKKRGKEELKGLLAGLVTLCALEGVVLL